MKRHVFTICAAVVMLCASAFCASAQEGTAAGGPQSLEGPPVAPAKASTLTMNAPILDKNSLADGGEITLSGKAPAGAKVFFEVSSADKKVRANQFDNKKDPKTGKPPYMFYLSEEVPAYYCIFLPKEQQGVLDKAKATGSGWKYSEVLKDTGAEAAYLAPSEIKIDKYQATIMASIIGSRGNLQPAMDKKDSKRKSMQLVKGRFKQVDRLLQAAVDMKADGSYSATITMPPGQAPGKYNVTAVAVTGEGDAAQKVKAETVSFSNSVKFPVVYLNTAGTSINLLWPFLLTLVIAIFGVLMGAGGGFILNPLLVTFFPLPHTVVAGTVMPTILFSQSSGIYNYSKIKFINWKLGAGVGCAMLVGGFIGPKLTELITVDQFKFIFGWVLLVLAALMFWQTSPGYLEKNKKEQSILKEFKKRAAGTAKG